MLFQAISLVNSRLVGVHLRGEGEAPVFPFGVARPPFLLPTNIGSSGVDFVVALLLEVVECFCVVVKIGDSGPS